MTQHLKGLYRVITVLMWTVVTAAALGTLLAVVTAIAPSISQHLKVTTFLTVEVDGASGVLETGRGTTEVRVTEARAAVTVSPTSAGLLAITALFAAAYLGVLCFITVNLRRIVRAVADGRPFVSGMAKSVQLVGWSAIGAAILGVIHRAVVYFYAVRHLVSDQLSPYLRLNPGIGYLVGGVLLILLGEIFRKGESLQQEHDLTV
jgi:hypothetical protein